MNVSSKLRRPYVGNRLFASYKTLVAMMTKRKQMAVGGLVYFSPSLVSSLAQAMGIAF